MLQLRQGDLFFEEVSEIPQNLTYVNKVLAVGEVSGHAHILAEESDVDVFLADGKDAMVSHYIQVNSPAEVTHSILQTGHWSGEHNPIMLPKGKFKVIRQREFNPFSLEVKRIED
ncbi:MAG: hypothetical protein ACXITV_00975 [Luteibaculaceae bacterium]